MSTKRKPGRPKLAKSERRSEFIPATRVSVDESKLISAAIESSGKDKTDWIRDTLLAAARRA